MLTGGHIAQTAQCFLPSVSSYQHRSLASEGLVFPQSGDNEEAPCTALQPQDSWDLVVEAPFDFLSDIDSPSGSSPAATLEETGLGSLPAPDSQQPTDSFEAWAAPGGLHRLPSQQYPSQVTSGCPNLEVPASAFTSPTQEQLDSQQVVISICRPQQVSQGPVSMPIPVQTLKAQKLSWSNSERMEHVQQPAAQHSEGSGRLQKGLSTTSSAPVASVSSADRDDVPVPRPTIQTGTHSRSESAPPVTGGKRVLRTADERKAHRMAKNRATAAASRQRKQAAQHDLMGRQEQLEEENARLLELLSNKDAQIHDIRQHIEQVQAGHFAASQAPYTGLVSNPFAQLREDDSVI